MNRDEIITQMTILIDKSAEEGYHMGYMEAKDGVGTMTRDEMLAMFTEMIDRCWEAGFDEGYRRGMEDQDA